MYQSQQWLSGLQLSMLPTTAPRSFAVRRRFFSTGEITKENDDASDREGAI